MLQSEIGIDTRGRGTYEFTDRVAALVAESEIDAGSCHLFVRHTSASLMLCENADPDVRRDLETFMSELAPDGDPRFLHVAEGSDDMPAHVRSILTLPDMTIPIFAGRLGLGTWQGIYLWEHRRAPHHRRVVVTIR